MPDVTPPAKSTDIHRHGTMGQGGDTRRGETAMRPADHEKNPDARSTVPDAADTNVDHPDAPSTRRTYPGEGVVGLDADTGAGSTRPSHAPLNAPNAGPIRQPAPEHAAIDMGLQPKIKDGVNRVEDDLSADTPRLSVPTDQVGPAGGHTQTPELQDPNYTAATPGAKGRPANGRKQD